MDDQRGNSNVSPITAGIMARFFAEFAEKMVNCRSDVASAPIRHVTALLYNDIDTAEKRE